MKRVLCHITAPDNVDSILKQGLIAKTYDDDGNKGVFLFQDLEYVSRFSLFFNTDGSINKRYRPTWTVANEIAVNQVWLKRYALFEVKVEADCLLPDNVGEETAIYQYIYTKDISPKAIVFRGIYDAKNQDKFPVFDVEKECLVDNELSEKLWEQTRRVIKRHL